MASTSQLNIKNPEARRLATELAALTGQTVSDVVVDALRERLEAMQRRSSRVGISERLLAIAQEASLLPVLDARRPDDMLYGEDGLPR